MTIKEFNNIIKVHNIPENARMMSDSGWECDATDMNGIYYNPIENIVVFTQCATDKLDSVCRKCKYGMSPWEHIH